MTQLVPTRRGRPKGTGIDDRPRLREIAAVIARQPEIRPTTAIRLLGENDPSVIRRLRDKFHAMQGELMTEVRRAAAEPKSFLKPAGELAPEQEALAHEITQLADATASKIASIADTSQPKLHLASTELPEQPAKPLRRPSPSAMAAQAASAGAMAAVGEHGENAYDAFIGLTIEATVSALEQQMRIYEQALRIPTVAMMVRNHIAVSEALMNIACTAVRANRALAAVA